ncbi:family 78 glycoside hydrolase catalytic domain [Fodinicola acaciae]|uniref:family 78 glycoside hydrolase catalytic domain n=1 Tax=Fodinicola acaciae TaxID=2681555 RepID=UPI0013D76537|nr:family 78 glycoside hydrolase catalytic domain [Fodinicola acaciae]
MTAPSRLQVEHLVEPFGIDVASPRLSWWLPAGTSRQLAYQIRAGAWDSGRVESARSLLVSYGGPALSSGQRVSWQVKVWTEQGESDWSAPSWWEMGLLSVDDWSAQWIEPYEPATDQRPGYVLRQGFSLAKPVVRARAYATAHGIYELFLNDERVGDQELSPGFTSYRHRLQVQAYDLTDLLATGENAVSAVLTDGWYRGRTGFGRWPNGYGDRVAFLAKLVIEHDDGTRTVVGTGRGWRSRTESIVAADLMDGQIADFDRPPGEWHDVVVAKSQDFAHLTTSPAPPVRRVEEIRPRSVTTLADRQIVDLGQNINGWIRLANPGGDVTLTHGEAVDASGDVTMDHLAGMDFATGQALSSGQVDRVRGTAAVFEPRHTTHGFQYVRVEGQRVTADDVTGVVVHTDLRRTGWFECDDDRINRLHEAAVWSFRGNACDIPTDCPTRERAGWTGDWQLYVPTAAFLYDVAGFSVKWLRDLAADQYGDGAVPQFAPFPPDAIDASNPLATLRTSAGWGDASVIVPWQLWRAYGDLDILEEQFPSMTAWVDYAARMARENRHPDRAAARPRARAYEEFLWDTGFHWGEWLEPGEEPALDPTRDNGHIATAFLHYSARLLVKIGRLLGKDVDEYERIANGALEAWRSEYLGADGTVTPPTQATYVRALKMGLIPEELRASAADQLVKLVRAADTHLGTGFLATPDLLPVLADNGHPDVAYDLLFQDSAPAWLPMIDKGATTIWEDWDGISATGEPKASLNHYSKGAVISFLHTRTAGIRLPEDPGDAPAYRRFVVEPVPGGGLTSVSARHDSPYGRISVDWRITDGRFAMDVKIPPGTSAQVRLPDGSTAEAPAGRHTYAV